MSNYKFKSKVQADAGVQLPAETATRALQLDGSGNIQSSSVTNTELGYVSGVTSAIQTQLNAKATDADVIKKDGSVAFTGDQSMGGNQLTNLGAPSAADDAATKSYVDSVAQGLKPKQAVLAATLVDGALATAYEDGQIIDGVTLVTGDRILIKDQTDATENGIYIVEATGAPTRAPDFDSLSPIDEINGAYTFIQEGTQAGQGWVQTGVVVTIGVSDIDFVYFNAVGTIVGGDGITVTGNTVSIDHDGEGLTFVANQLALELDGATLSKSASGLKLGDTAVTPGSFGSATAVSTFTVDQQGRLTAAGATTIAIPASQVTDFNEAAQDAVGTILVDTASVDLVYTDGTPSITATVLPAGVDHDLLLNYVADEHVDHSTVEIETVADSGLTGGGDITATRSLSVDINGTTAETTPAAGDEILIYDVSAAALRKMTRANFLSGFPVASAGDLNETSFSGANNQVAAADVTGFAFANGVVRSFRAQVSIFVDATTDLFETYDLMAVQKGAGWDLTQASTGDASLVVFSITSAGQIQYTSGNYTGFSALTVKFRATTTSV